MLIGCNLLAKTHNFVTEIVNIFKVFFKMSTVFGSTLVNTFNNITVILGCLTQLGDAGSILGDTGLIVASSSPTHGLLKLAIKPLGICS